MVFLTAVKVDFGDGGNVKLTELPLGKALSALFTSTRGDVIDLDGDFSANDMRDPAALSQLRETLREDGEGDLKYVGRVFGMPVAVVRPAVA